MRRLLSQILIFTLLVEPLLATTYTPATAGALTTALASAACGDLINLTAGSDYSGHFTLRNAGDCSANPIILQTAPSGSLPADGVRIGPSYASFLATLHSPDADTYVMQVAQSANGWTIRNIYLKQQCGGCVGTDGLLLLGSSSETVSANQPTNIIIDQLLCNGQTFNIDRCITANSRTTTVQNSYIYNIHDTGFDSQAILFGNGPGPYTITNNYLESAGENIMVGGFDPAITGLIPGPFTFNNNQFAKNVAWNPRHASYDGSTWVIKNCFELKKGHDVAVYHNIFENVWTGGQQADCIVVNIVNQSNTDPTSTVYNLNFHDNIIRNAGNAVALSACPYPCNPIVGNTITPGHDYTITNNLAYNFGNHTYNSADGDVGTCLSALAHFSSNVTITHNTCIADTAHDIIVTGGHEIGVTGVVIKDNIWKWGSYGILDGSGNFNKDVLNLWTGATYSYNAMPGVTEAGYSAITDFTGYGPGNVNLTLASLSAQFTNPATGDYRLVDASSFATGSSTGGELGVDMCNGNFPDPAGDGNTTFACAPGTTTPKPRLRSRSR